MVRRGVIAALLAGAVGGGSAASVPALQLAEACERKIQAVQARAALAAPDPLWTAFDEAELNAYLRLKMTDRLPEGLTEPALTLIGERRVAARAVVDLDLVRTTQGSGRWFDPTSYLTGRIAIGATGQVHTEGGMARVEVERVDVAGVPVPRQVLQQIVAHYTKSAHRPDGARMDDPFAMPAGIRRIDVSPGRAVVVQ